MKSTLLCKNRGWTLFVKPEISIRNRHDMAVLWPAFMLGFICRHGRFRGAIFGIPLFSHGSQVCCLRE